MGDPCEKCAELDAKLTKILQMLEEWEPAIRRAMAMLDSPFGKMMSHAKRARF